MVAIKRCYFRDKQLERFWKKTKPGLNGCIEWTGARNHGRWGAEYGLFRVSGQTYLVHRLAYVLAKGEIPKDLTIDHLCCNKLCVNAEHLEAVTQSENIKRYHRAQPISYICKHGHPREPGRPCKTCSYQAVKRSIAKNPEKYKAMNKGKRNLQRHKARARLTGLTFEEYLNALPVERANGLRLRQGHDNQEKRRSLAEHTA